jgi:hypothetical protein
MNYAALVQMIEDYAENTESLFVANIPNFVKQAESRIYQTVHIPVLRKNVTGAITSGNKYLSTPDDFLATYSIAVIDPVTGAYSYLLDKDVSFIREAYPIPTSTGTPKYYAIFGPQSAALTELTFILGPTPDANYTTELHYFYYPVSIVTNGTSWLGDNFDPVLFYGAMREAMIFMKGEQDMVAYYEQKYAEAIAQLTRLVNGLERGDAYRDGQTKIPAKGL